MSERMKSKYLYIGVLLLITIFICVVNYKSGTFLTGWDTLHPEFNFKVYWSRVFFSVWQEHQGLGAVASQAHAAEIPRVLILQLLSLIFPLASLRYIYFFICLLLGPLGVYFFIKKIILNNISDDREGGSLAFLGALVYLLNLSTLQQFYVPLEMFATHFASLGWLCLLASRYIFKRDRKILLYFFLASFLSSPMAHTATLWYAFFIAFSGYLFLFTLQNLRLNPGAMKSFFNIVIVLIISNSFWLFPNVYFALNHGADVQNSKIHRLFSQEAFLQNREFGNFKDIALLKNFLFDWGENVGGGRYGQLLDEWSSHLGRFGVVGIGYGVFAVVIFGILVSIFFKRYRRALSAFFIFLLSWFFIANTNPPFDKIFTLLQENLPLFKEALRFPFTKFSILLSFSYAIFFSTGISMLYFLIKNRLSTKLRSILISVVTIVVTVSLIYYMLPAFKGNLISSSMKMAIPNRYFDMFSFFSDQKEDFRIATFPINTLFGWQYYNWDKNIELGYQGAGFLWFGIPQPIMDREFDRWFPTNEQYYREMSYAVYSKNVSLFSNLLSKYGIRYLILDESVMAIGDDPNTKALFIDEIKELFGMSGKINLERDFGEGLSVYKVEGTNTGFVYAPKAYSIVNNPSSRGFIDSAYSSLGDYVSEENSQSGLYNPLRDIYSVSEEVVDNVLMVSGGSYKINVPDMFDVVAIPGREGTNKELIEDSIYVGNTELSSSSGPLLNSFNNTVFTTDMNLSAFPIKPENCFSLDKDQLFGGEVVENGVLLKGRNTISCLTYSLKDLLKGFSPKKSGYFILKVTFDYEAFAEEYPAYCLLDSRRGTCLNNLNRFLSYKPDRVEDYVFLSYADLDSYYLRFMLDALNSGKTTTISYLDGNLSILEASETPLLGLDSSSPFIDYSGDIVGNFFGSVNYNYDITKVKRNLSLCGFKIPEYQERSVEEGGGSIKYASKDGFVCDFFLYPNLPHSFGYILEIRSKNVSGLPLRVCLKNNVSGRCDLYVSLPANKGFASNYYLIPSGYYGDFGYSLELTNLSFGDLITENLLQSVRLLPFSYDYISNIYYQHSDTERNIKLNNGVIILSSVKYAAPFYKVRTSGEGIFVLAQSYDKGWLAFNSEGSILPHRLANSWANGWLLDCTDTADCVQTIHIFYWPQILEFLGLAITFMYAVCYLLRRRP